MCVVARLGRQFYSRWIVFSFSAALLCLLPSSIWAQSQLPVSWLYSSINQVTSVAYSPDGTLIAVAGASGVQICSASTNAVIRCLPTSALLVDSVAFSPDGKSLAVGGSSGTNGVLELWSVSSGTLTVSLPTGENLGVRSVAFSPNGQSLVVCGTNSITGGLEIWDVATATLTAAPFTYVAYPVQIVFSPDGKTFAIGGSDSYGEGFVELWVLPSVTETFGLLTSVKGGAYGLAFSPDGKTLATGGSFYDDGQGAFIGQLELWNVATGARTGYLPTAASQVTCVNFSPDGKVLADSGDGFAELWDTSKGILTSTLSAGFGVGSIAFSPDSKTVLLGGAAYVNINGGVDVGIVQAWDVSTLTMIPSPTAALFSAVSAAAFSSDGVTAAGGGYSLSTAGVRSGALDLWNTSTGRHTASLTTAASSGVNATVFSPNGSTLASGGLGASGGVLELWNPATGMIATSLPTGASLGVSALQYSPSGAILASGGTSASGGVLELWNTTSNTLTGTLATAENGAMNAIAFSPNGTQLAVGGYSTAGTQKNGLVELWNPSSQNLSLTIAPTGVPNISSVAFSPDGAVLAISGSGLNSAVVQLYSATTGKLIGTLPLAGGAYAAYSVFFSSDGTYLFVGTNLGIQVISIPTQSVLMTFNGGILDTGVSAQMTPNGSQLGYFTTLGSIAVSPNPAAPVAPSGVSLSPSSVQGGNPTTGTVTLSSPAPAIGATIPLSSSSSSAAVPASVHLAPGATSATFTVTTLGVDSQAVATISAGSGSGAKAASLTITPASLAEINLSSSTIAGGHTTTGTVTLGGSAGPAGVVIVLSSSNPVVTLPASVKVASGKSSVAFTVTTVPVTKQMIVAIEAKSGGVSESANLTVNPPAPASVTLNPTTVIGTNTSTGTVTLTEAAPRGGLLVKLASNSKSAAILPSVRISSGATTATFKVTTFAVSSKQTVAITASMNGFSQSAVLTIIPPSLESLTITPSSVVGGISSFGTLKLNAPAPVGGLKITLASNTSAAKVSTPVLVAAGRTSATFVVKTIAVGTETNATITSTLGTESKTAVLAIQPPKVKSLILSPSSVKGGKMSVGTLVLTSAAPTGGLTITLSSSSSLATVPASLVVESGRTAATFQVKTTTTKSRSSAVITAALNGNSKNSGLTILP